MTLRFADELRFFLAARLRRQQEIQVRVDGTSTLGHLVQSLGVPLTETGALTVDGHSSAPSCRPRGGETAHIAAVPRPQPVPSAPPTFVLDVHLGALARRLRLVGLDCAYGNDRTDDSLLAQANAERRILLTRDRGLLQRGALWLGAYVRGARPDDQLLDVMDRFAPGIAPWTRCPACNGLLSPVPKSEVANELPYGTRRTYDTFTRCRGCDRLYWRGAHGRRLEAAVEAAERTVRARRQA